MKKLTDEQISKDILRGLKDKKKFALRWSSRRSFYAEIEATDIDEARKKWDNFQYENEEVEDEDDDDLEIQEIDE